jgi:epoxyqueuosine reductase QueG
MVPVTKNLPALLGELEVDLAGAARLGGRAGSQELEKARRLLPEAKSVIALAMEIPEEVFRHLTYRQEVGDLALRDLYGRTEELIAGRLNWEAYRLVKKLHALGYKALALPAGGPYDMRVLSGPLSYKHAAQAAGLGTIGWHSLLITPEYGPRVKLALVLTDAGFPASSTAGRTGECLRCGACLRACPAQAISQPDTDRPYRLDVHACNSFLAAVGLCAECMKVCPGAKGGKNG